MPTSSRFNISALMPCMRPILCLISFLAFVLNPSQASSRSPAQLIHKLVNTPSISFPVLHSSANYHGNSPAVSRQTLDMQQRNILTNSSRQSAPSSLRSELITLGEPLGQYFALLQLGTPATEITVIVDTGSGFLWVQCQPCTECGPQSRDPIFDPARSSSFQAINCGSSDCQGDAGVYTTCDEDSSCEYQVAYGDNSKSTGMLSTETLTIASATGTAPFREKKLVFGCGTINEGVETTLRASGLMGLNRGKFSVPSQLGVHVFAYCLPDRVKNVQATGYLTFGPTNSTASQALQYTPLIQNNQSELGSQFFYLNMTGVSVNGKLLYIPSTAFEIDELGNGGTIIDSGTAFTRFVDEAYTVFVKAFEGAMNPSVRKASLQDYPTALCYEVPKSQLAPQAPNVTFHLAGAVEIHLQTDQLLAYTGADEIYDYYCMAFADSGSDAEATNILGNYQQQNLLVEYDVGNARVGFAPTQCSNGSTSSTGLSCIHSFWFTALLALLAHFLT